MNLLITGASKGIGAALAESASAAGHTVLLVSRNSTRLELVAGNCNRMAGMELAHAIPFDLTDLSDLQDEFTTRIEAITGRLDAIVNNAGQLINKSFLQVTPREARGIFDTNFFAPAFLIRACLPLMAGSELKHVVNITSMAGYQGSAKFAGLSYYSASKAALGSLTECLAQELKVQEVKVNALAIGSVQTEMLAEAFPGLRAPLVPSQMAEYLLWFTLEGSKYFNGKVLPVSRSTP
jgi:3-oxoacyl-[acyl-carrier protein] reductase